MSIAPHLLSRQVSTRVDRLRARRVDPYEFRASVNEVYDRMVETSSAVKYAIGAMQPIDPTYTQNTYREGDRVKNQLDKAGLTCEFEYQGSVTSDTHIKARSDIDLLTLTCQFVVVEPPVSVGSPYVGNPIDDLLRLRRGSIATLRAKFPEAEVDESGSKSVSIQGGSLRRKVDVVASNWRDTLKYHFSRQMRDRGVDVLDAKAKTTISNLPLPAVCVGWFFHCLRGGRVAVPGRVFGAGASGQGGRDPNETRHRDCGTYSTCTDRLEWVAGLPRLSRRRCQAGVVLRQLTAG